MIISKTPFRISFFGGGTDLKEYYLNNTGIVASTTIDKYIYITVNKRFDNSIRISYSKTEIVEKRDEIQHPIVREALKLLDIEGGIEITSISDIPSKTGLGSSSTFTVGLLNALYAYKGVYVNSETLAKEACKIEIDILKEPIGKQDQYAAAYGGLNYITFNNDETVSINPIICSKNVKNKFENNLLLFYTGITRSAGRVLDYQKKNTCNNIENLTSMKVLVDDFKHILSEGSDLKQIGKKLNDSWMLKRKLSDSISNSFIDSMYNLAMNNGAIGGKVLGAGGGGFLLFFCEPHNQKKLIYALKDLRYVPFKFETQGSKIIFID